MASRVLTWTCHVCGDERPDAAISVYRRKLRHTKTGIESQENVRYCNDRPGCVAGAPDKRFLPVGSGWEDA